LLKDIRLENERLILFSKATESAKIETNQLVAYGIPSCTKFSQCHVKSFWAAKKRSDQYH